MKKHELKDYNRLLRAEIEALKYILQEAEDSLGDGCRCGEIKLLQEENTELLKDINDLHAEYAKSHVDAGKALCELVSDIRDLRIKHTEETQELRSSFLKQLKTIKERETRANDENVRLQSKIAGLKNEMEVSK
ncbi:MAG: hypothetical protein ABGU93_06815 [Acetobacterium sp.]|uniref:hypothetical protein n=1 Tax=Acetobacterium sp. TaxID=1872094 RepID=UPI003242816B